jgi:hypothetical protein
MFALDSVLFPEPFFPMIACTCLIKDGGQSRANLKLLIPDNLIHAPIHYHSTKNDQELTK